MTAAKRGTRRAASEPPDSETPTFLRDMAMEAREIVASLRADPLFAGDPMQRPLSRDDACAILTRVAAECHREAERLASQRHEALAPATVLLSALGSAIGLTVDAMQRAWRPAT